MRAYDENGEEMFNINMSSKCVHGAVGLVLVAMCVLPGCVAKAQHGPQRPLLSVADLEKLVARPANIASSAYQYRSDRPADQNDPESWILVMRHVGMPLDKPSPTDVLAPAVKGVLCAQLWEEVRRVRKVEVTWTDDRHPAAGELTLMYADGDQWWSTGTKKANRTESSPDGRKHVFTVPKDTFGLVLCVRGPQGRPKDASAYSVPQVQAFGPDVWKKTDLEIEWGFGSNTSALNYDGRIEVYDGVLSDVQALAGDNGTVTVGPREWQSSAAKRTGPRRGVRLSMLYIGVSPWRRMWPNVPSPADLPRTIVTVQTKAGSFSFLAADLENGPILAPEYGFFVRRVEAADTGPEAGRTADKAKTVAKDLLRDKLDNLLGNADLRGWGKERTPWLAVNATGAPIVANSNITFPARGVAVHPGQDSDVGVSWRSPVAAKIGVRARVAGLQPGGDGIVWCVMKESSSGIGLLAKGTIQSGGAQLLAPPGDIEVQAGDIISLMVNRKGNHSCDSTAVQFSIDEKGGKRRAWDLTKDVLGTIQAGNPHADTQQNAGVWAFFTVAGAASPIGPSSPAAHQPPHPMQSKAASARDFIKELEAKGLKTVRQRVRKLREQTWEGATKARFPGRKLPPIPKSKLLPAMQVEVPCKNLTAQWNLGAWHILRHAERTSKGEVRLNDFPYSVLAEETFLMLYALDLAGMHKEVAQGLDLWLDLPIDLPKPVGYFSDGRGVFSHAHTGGVGGPNMDAMHSMGPGTIGWMMAEHYRLTGDKDWLKAKAPRMKANVEWILRQRRLLADILPGGQCLWSKGLQPAHQLTPDAGGMFAQFYVSNGYYWLAVRGLADVLADIDPVEAARLSAEADAYRRDILAAVERSIALSPVIPVRDGTYRSFIPPACHIRGCASLGWIWRRRHSFNHWDGIAWDISMGATALLSPVGLMPLSDPRAQGHMDVLEDRLLLENRKVYMRKADYDPQRDWFDCAGWHHQCAYEKNSIVHLAWDDAPNFLRATLNQYAVHIVPGPYTFSEHSTRGPADKPFEEAGFMERFRGMLVFEEGANLWLARATPRAWLEQGKKIRVRNAPTHFGTVDYEIVSDADHGKITATVRIPSRNPPKQILLRLRHPKTVPIRRVMVNGKPWAKFDAAKEVIRLHGMAGTATVEVNYR